MEHVTTDRRDSTSPSSLLHSRFLFFLCCFLPPPLFLSLLHCPSRLSLLTHTFPPHSCYLPIIYLKMSMHTVIYLCCWPPCNVPSFCPLFLSFHVFPCETTTPPSSLSNCMCIFSLHTLLHSSFCFSPSCRHILPSGAPSLPPYPP